MFRPSFCAFIGVVTAAAFTLGCPGSVTSKGVEAPNSVSLRKQPAASSKYLLRKPKSTGQVSEGAQSADWGKFEIGLFDSGLTMVDSALLEELLRSNASPSYEAIRDRTGADVVIEAIDFGGNNRKRIDLHVETPRHAVSCVVDHFTVKLVDVGSGSMLGTLDVGRSACPAAMTIEWPASRTEDMQFKIDGQALPPERYKRYDDEYIIDLPPADWREMGKQLGLLIQKQAG